MRVLVVDDNPINLKIVQFNLKQLDVECDFAANGLEAVDRYKEFKYPLIFMDIQMPIMDGISASKEIRKFELENDIESLTIIVALTANTFDDNIDEYKEAGMNTFIAKPINEDALKEILSQVK
ncbi:response regulator [Prolixibacteraceae bacterium JC049]|nr:response regulator [Prolixibacteraceae bacterium JC049]